MNCSGKFIKVEGKKTPICTECKHSRTMHGIKKETNEMLCFTSECINKRLIKSKFDAKEFQRISYDEYFMKMCDVAALRATCPRKSVGCIIVKDSRVLSTGYNGAPKGFVHCTKIGCKIQDNHCVRVVHAEMNALLFAGKEAQGATLYSNVLPCQICFKLAIQAGISKIVYHEDYNHEEMQWLTKESKIQLVRI